MQEDNPKTRELRKYPAESLEDIEDIFHHQGFLYVSNIVYFEIMSRYYDDLLASHFGIKKIKSLLLNNTFGQSSIKTLKLI